MESTLSQIITVLRPEEPFYVVGDSVDDVHFISDGVTPVTQAEVDAARPQVEYQVAYESIQQQRQAAYQQEADPIFFQSQRGKKTKQEWLDKIDEIDARLPYPVKDTGKK